jgi:hypothetical protein
MEWVSPLGGTQPDSPHLITPFRMVQSKTGESFISESLHFNVFKPQLAVGTETVESEAMEQETTVYTLDKIKLYGM